MMLSFCILQVILTLLCGFGCHGNGGGVVDVGINLGDSNVNIDLSGIFNPCESHTCKEGQKCTVIYHPEFLDVPIAHCIDTHAQTTEQNTSPCIELKVGSNVMRCKTEREWSNIGVTQCALRGGAETPSLYNTQVAYACHRFDNSLEAMFLQATFTCCLRLPDSTPQDEQSIDSQQAQTEEVTDGSQEDEPYENHILVFPLIIAVAMLVAFFIITMAVWQRRRSKLRGPKVPKLIIATSFVNPSAEQEDTPTYDITDEYTGRSDKSLLIINEHTEYAPGN